MATPRIKDRKELTQEWIRRVVTYTDKITWFGANSIALAWAKATGALSELGYVLYIALLRRFTIMSSKDEELAVVAAERGASRLGTVRAKVLAIIQPFKADVTAITLGATDLIEVNDSSQFLAADSIRIRNGDGSVSEVKAIIAITIGTGPNGNDELEVTALVNVYTPATDDVDVLSRYTAAEGTLLTATTGVEFQTLETITTGDANPVLDGEGTFLGLADKVFAECTTRGASGNVEPEAITGFSAGTVRGVVRVFNPERATGGSEQETDFELKTRTINGPAIAAMETEAWFEALAVEGNNDVLRVVRPTDTALGTLIMRVLHRNGGGFSTSELSDLETFIESRVRSFMTIDLSNVALTSVEIDAQILLEANVTLQEVWKEYSSRAAAYLDYRKRIFGEDADFSDLRKVLERVPGVASVDKTTFLPATDVAVADLSLPTLTRISLLDQATSDTVNGDLTVAF